MFSARRALPRALPRTRATARRVSEIPPPPPPQPIVPPIAPPPPPPPSARPSRLRGFALKTASLGFAGWAMIASQNEATIMLEQAQGITRAPPAHLPNISSKISSLSAEEHTGEGPDFDLPGQQSEGGEEEEERELTQEEIDQIEADKNDPKNQAAYNEETGEINWDCPCLGGMAHGPCGDQFRASFSCFVHSEEEPKGIECVESFKAMQNCFREYPEIYGGDAIDDDEDSEYADEEFDRAHPAPSQELSEEDADLVAQAEKALGSKVEEGLQQAKEGGEQLFNVEGGELGGKGQTAREPNLQ